MKNVALITGASSGIGKELAHIHAKKGGDMVVVARSSDKLNELKHELEEKYKITVMIIAKDLTQLNAAREIYSSVNKEGVEIEYLMNNAGFGGIGKFHERDWEKDEAMINLNILALTALTRLFLPAMVERNHGRILNVSSTASLMPGPLQAVYYASKAYVTSFSNAIAEELSDTNVTVTALLPGATETEFGAISGMDKTELFDKTASAETVANKGYSAMMKGNLNVIAGLPRSLKIMMKLIPFMPKKAMLKQVRKMQEEK
ncbi:MAG: SDR family oxidoreductase [Salinivirgaceae bacterium]